MQNHYVSKTWLFRHKNYKQKVLRSPRLDNNYCRANYTRKSSLTFSLCIKIEWTTESIFLYFKTICSENKQMKILLDI